jgi:hypothetical protein
MLAAAAEPAVVAGDVDALVESLAMQAQAVVPLAGLADQWGLPEPELAAIVAAAVDAGRVERWPDAPNGPAIILSAASADALGLELATTPGPAYSDRWLASTLRWIKRGTAPAERVEYLHEVAKLVETDLIDPGFPRCGFSKPVSGGSIRENLFDNGYREPRSRGIEWSRCNRSGFLENDRLRE